MFAESEICDMYSFCLGNKRLQYWCCFDCDANSDEKIQLWYKIFFQIKYEFVNANELIFAVNNESARDFAFDMRRAGVITNVSVAMVLGDCVGPFKDSYGNCSYKYPPENSKNLFFLLSYAHFFS